MVWRFRISKRDRPFRFAHSQASKSLCSKGCWWWAGSRRCKNGRVTCCRTSQILSHCFRRQLYLLIRFARFRSETRNPFLPKQFFPFSPTSHSLLLGSPWVLPMVSEKLSPIPFSWELVSGLVLEFCCLLKQESYSASAPVLPLPVSE